jgi:hypothetical protein
LPAKSSFPMCLTLVASAVNEACQSDRVLIEIIYLTEAEHTFESLLCGCGISTSAVEVVASTDGYDTATDLESSGHVVECCGEVGGGVCDEVCVSKVR